MHIQIVIQLHKSCLRNVETIERLPNSHYDPALHYKAIDNASRYAYHMINHPDWSLQLQEEHYPNGIGDIAYPVSC